MEPIEQGRPVICRKCGEPVDSEHRFCPWCAAPQRRKAVAQFSAHAEVDAPGRGLRVSRYYDPADGPPHTRLSVFDEEGRVTSVVALDDATTAELARFLVGLAADVGLPLAARRSVLERIASRLAQTRQ